MRWICLALGNSVSLGIVHLFDNLLIPLLGRCNLLRKLASFDLYVDKYPANLDIFDTLVVVLFSLCFVLLLIIRPCKGRELRFCVLGFF